jgi:translocation protein SEC63
MEGDPVTARLSLLLTRPAHTAPGAEASAPTRGGSKAVRAFTPSSPVPKDECW